MPAFGWAQGWEDSSFLSEDFDVYNSGASDFAPEAWSILNEEDDSWPELKQVVDSLDLKDMDILDALKLLSMKSGLNIVAGRDIKGKVTVYLQKAEVGDILRIVLKSNKLAYERDGNILRVIPEKEFEQRYGYKFGEGLQTEFLPLHHAYINDVIPLLEQMKSAFGKVIANTQNNSLLLSDLPSKLEEMKLFIQSIDVPVKTQVFQLNHAQAEDLLSKMTEALTPGIGKITADEQSNRIIIKDIPQKIKDITMMIQTFDIKQKEVSISAKIIQITLSDQFKLGIDWEAIVSDYHNLRFNTDLDVLDAISRRGTIGIGTVSEDDYEVLLEAVNTLGDSKILSNPQITVLNNKEAKILVGSTEPYVTTTTTTPASGPVTISESINFIEVGVKLYVTPTIHEDQYITMKINPEVSSVTRNLTTSNNNTIPIVDTSEAETTVMVKDGVTIIIGGMIKEEKISTVNKLPFLGSIPGLGMAFRNKDELKRTTETVIFLTPYIISGDVDSPTDRATPFPN